MPELETPRMEAFAAKLVEMQADPTLTRQQAALEAGYSPASAAVRASQLRNNPAVLSRAMELAEQQGLSLNNCLTTLGDGLKAKKSIVLGESLVEVDDWTTKTKCAEIGLKVHKAVDTRTEGDTTINVLATGDWASFMESYFAARDKA